MVLSATTDGKKLEFTNPERLEEYLTTVKNKPLLVSIRARGKGRSKNQNSYYWVCIHIMATSLGYTDDELHATMRARLLTDRSGLLPVVRSTSVLTTSEFNEYLEHVKRIAAELGIILPDPNEENTN